MLLPQRVWLHEWADFPAISPDGREVVFAGVADGVRRLYVRPMNGHSFHSLPGTEGAYGPFWLPDGRSVGFFAGESIRRVDITGGGVVTIGTYQAKGNVALRTGTANRQGVVLFADAGTLWRAGERVATRVVAEPGSPGADGQEAPEFVGDGQHFLYFAGGKHRGMYLGSLANPRGTRMADIPSPAHYAAGHLLYVQQRTLTARPFDPDRLEVRGGEFPVADGVVASHFSAAQDGTIVYRPAESELASLVWFDRSGSRLGSLGDVAEYRHIALSPSGRRVAVARGDPSQMDVWVADATTGVFARVTRLPGSEADPVWSPDERSVAYSYLPQGDPAATQPPGVRRLDLTSGADAELGGTTCSFVDDWTADGRVICRNDENLVALLAQGMDTATTLQAQPDGDQWDVSPDGRWIAYNSPASGESEVYVAPVDRMTSTTRVSVASGVQPLWRKDGRELFYLTLDGTVMSVAIRTLPTFHADTPKPLFKATTLVPAEGWPQYAVSPDGQRFLIKEPVRQFFTVLQNWFSAQNK